MAADVPQTPKGAPWAMARLYSAQQARSCTAPLVDTVLLDAAGRPQVWLAQNKEGAIAPRKAVSDSAVIETFKRQALSHANNVHRFCAVAYFVDGSHRTLDEEAFGTLMDAFSAGVKDCHAVQCYTHARGGDGAMFRVEYAVGNPGTGAGVTSTWKHTKYFLNVPAEEVAEAVTRSHNDGVNRMLARITDEVVAHLQAVTPNVITRVKCDFVMDEQDQPALLWVHDLLVAPRAVVPAYGASDASGPLGAAGAADEPSLSLSQSTFADRRHRQLAEEAKAETAFATFDEVVGTAVGDGWRGRVCICDSDAGAVMTALEALAEQGYAVTVVADGPKALARTRDEGFDALLLARDLPSVSGVEVTRIIRQREGALAHTAPGTLQMRLPIIAFTEHTTAEDLRVYMEVGMDGCICKPLEVGSLLNTVAAAVPMPAGGPPPHVRAAAADSAAIAAMPASAAAPGGPYATTQSLPPAAPVDAGATRTRMRKSKKGRASRRSAAAPPVTTSLSVPVAEGDAAISGVFQLDAETAIPYTILGSSMEGAPLFHFVVLQDAFETCEVWQIFFRSIVAKYPGMRVLLFNYPGQAFTEWRRDATLNNEYLAGVAEALLGYLSRHGNGEFALDDGEAPFYLMGVGNGGAIASYFATAYQGRHPNMRGLLLVNGHLYLDAHLAGVYHDCMNVFACTPASRPDLPVYFFSRYLFSPSYLSKVGAPLALNLYTAVHNPITLEGRIQLCQGALSHVDVRDSMEHLSLPVIAVASSKDGLVKPLHVQAAVNCRGGEERSIKRVLTTRRRVCVIWLRAGHELLQEARRPLSNLVEQLATGYHERNDVAFLPLAPEEPKVAGGTRGYAPPSAAAKASARARQRAAGMAGQLGAPQGGAAAPGDAGSGLTPGQPGNQAQLYEDKYLDDMVTSLRAAGGEGKAGDGGMVTMVEELEAHKAMVAAGAGGGAPRGNRAGAGGAGEEAEYKAMAAKAYAGADAMQATSYPAALDDAPPVPDELKEWQAAIARGEKPTVRAPKEPYTGIGYDAPKASKPLGRRAAAARAATKRQEMRSLNVAMNLDPEAAMFERRDGEGGAGAAVVAPVHAEVREYMAWRLKRNKKRFTRIVTQVKKIQRAWRAFLARTLVKRMRQQRGALTMQRWWRGCMGRAVADQKKRSVWAAFVIQKYWRGYAGRGLAWKMQLEERSARVIQSSWRGWRARRFVNLLRHARRDAAVKIQALWRQRMAMREAWRLRDSHNAAINIQRIWRGRLGRARARREREKYLFSKSQSQSIEFGRQMLMEHKLHATKLQSEVSILTKEKIETEEAVETVLKEIATFEAGVRALEKEMIDLSRAEAEAAGTLDEEAKLELRENKMRLDREFGAMLVKIADRREKLQGLERKLQRIDATREAKKEELQDLERKLVVLLEEQQRELKAIKVRQTKKGERLVEDAVAAVTETLASGGKTPFALGGGSGGVGGVGGAAAGGGTDLSALGGGPTPQQRAEANALMSSTETMMKFGFMSMSLTYFSSLNMIRAMRQVGTANTVLSNPMLAGGTMAALGKGLVGADGLGGTAATFQPALKPGQVAGQETTDVSLWTVGDVANWLDTLTLGQYKDAFADAAVDGAFLFDLTDDDLRSTLGIEHALHRKKILRAIERLRVRERQAAAASEMASMSSGGPSGMPSMGGGPSGMLGAMSSIGPSASMAAGRLPDGTVVGPATVLSGSGDGSSTGMGAAAGLRLADLMQWIAFGKAKKVANALKTLPERRFDMGHLQAQYVEGVGSQYDSALGGGGFHINAADEHGNTLLLKAAQSGQGHLAKLLVQHGAYINHQNGRGNTALHFALMYKDTDLAVWLADPEKGGIDDTLMNADGLTAYDGLSAEDA